MVDPSAGRGAAGRVRARGDVLVLIRRRDRRLLIADTRAAGPGSSREGGDPLDLFGSLEWRAASDERGTAERVLGGPVPRMDMIHWGPQDLVDGTIERFLR